MSPRGRKGETSLGEAITNLAATGATLTWFYLDKARVAAAGFFERHTDGLTSLGHVVLNVSIEPLQVAPAPVEAAQPPQTQEESLQEKRLGPQQEWID